MKKILQSAFLTITLIGFSDLFAQPGCPAVNAGSDAVLSCGQTCTTLRAAAFAGATTTSYTVDSIAYNPPFPFTAGTSIIVNIDDTYSEAIPLPFNFTFFGKIYDSITVGSNGVISFNMNNAASFSNPIPTNSWQITGPIPRNMPADLRNSIMGPWQDMDPTNRGGIHYQITGTYPCRNFEVSWDSVPYYGDPNSQYPFFFSDSSLRCPAYFASQQIVLYEVTNTIEMYIKNKEVCTGWNPGATGTGVAIQGIQDSAGAVAYWVPGRNATTWSAQNDAWRFTPAGALNTAISWYDGVTLISSTDTVDVCPATAHTYTAQAIYSNSDGSFTTVTDDVNVTFGNIAILRDSVLQPRCFGDSTGAIYVSLSSDTTGLTFGWTTGVAGELSLTGVPAGTYIFNVTDSATCSASDTVTLTDAPLLQVNVPDSSAFSCGIILTASLTANVIGGDTTGGDYSYLWANGVGFTQTVSALPTGSYSVIVADVRGCTATDSATVTLSFSTPVFNAPVITDVLCFGGTDGSIVVSVDSVTQPIIYTWSNSLPDNDTVTGLITGSYCVTATDAIGCSVSACYTVSEPSAIAIGSPTITEETCTVGGTISVTATGGTGTLNYNWSNADTGTLANSLIAGTYMFTVTDQNLCTDTASFIVTAAPGLSLDTPTLVNLSCNGVSTGSITANTIGGTGTILFAWSTFETTATISNLPAGCYSVSITDDNGCTDTATYCITEPAVIVFDTSVVTPAGCTTGGTILQTAIGGTGTIAYNWSNGDSTSFIDSLATALYTVTATDANLCTAVTTVFVPADTTAPTFGVPVIGDVLCYGDSTGIIIAPASGGTGPISYSWSNGTTTSLNNNLGAGCYSVTISDIIGCNNTATYCVAGPPAITLGTPTITNETCLAGGTISQTATGGSGILDFNWSNGDTGTLADSLVAGSYTLTVSDQNFCSVTASYNIIADPGLSLDVPALVNLSCNGISTGSITANTIGGTGTISFDWSNGANTAIIDSLPAGCYSVTVADANGCTDTATYCVTEPTAIVFDAPVVTSVNCTTGGTISQTATGGTGTIVYNWSNGDSTSFIDSLATASYTLTATDANSCTATTAVFVRADTTLPTFGSPVITGILCNGDSTGSIVASASGGTGTISFVWDNGAVTSAISNLAVGCYVVTITDSIGCQNSATYCVTQPSAIAFATPTVTNETCLAGGTILQTATGGAGTLNYLWSNGDTGTLADSLIAGTYTLTVTDQNLCSATASYSITGAPGLSLGNPVIVNLLCNGASTGSITPTVTGGTGTITFTWCNGATSSSINNVTAACYCLTVSDANGCTDTSTYCVTEPSPIVLNTPTITDATCQTGGTILQPAFGGTGPLVYSWSNGDSTNFIENLAAGSYRVTVVDANLCSVTDTLSVTADSSVVTFGAETIVHVICNGGNNGRINATANGGTGPITFVWSNNGVTGPNDTALIAGAYSVTISDQNSCTASTTYVVNQPTAIVPVLSLSNPICINTTGNGTISATGGAGGYTYRWSNGSDSTYAEDLFPGIVFVTVTDDSGCRVIATDTITQQPDFGLTSVVRSYPCSVPAYGNDTITVSGGVGPFTFILTGVDTNTTGIFNNLPSGSYSFTVLDVLGCSKASNFTIEQGATDDNYTVATNPASCSGGSDGSITVTALSGNNPYTYSLNGPFQSGNIFDSLTAGTYNLVARNKYGCTTSLSGTVNEPVADSFNIVTSPTSCFGNQFSDGVISITPLSGNGPYSYALDADTLQNNGIFLNISAGTHTVVTQSATGCFVTLSPVVDEPAQVTINATPDTIITSPGADQAVTVNAQNFANPVYTWSPAAGLSCTNCNNPTINVSESTVFNVTVSEAETQCSASDSVVVIVISGQYVIPTAFTPNGDNKNETFGPVKSGDIVVKEFRIYNRWGELVYNGTDNWDGKFKGADQPSGTYVYYIQIQLPDKNNPAVQLTDNKQGSFSLIR